MFTAVRFRCLDPERQVSFYVDRLGMQRRGDGRVAYAGASTFLEFLPSTAAYTHHPHDRYWKIALTLPNLDLAVERLRSAGVSVSDPRQFLDIGYLAHLQDPAGFVVELLQHDFKENRSTDTGNPALTLGGASLGLVTLRCADPDQTRRRCEALGMRLLVIEPVPSHGFTLYFYAFTDEVPPNSDPVAVENREWLYRRPYTVLEFQHQHAGGELMASAGFGGLMIDGLDEPFE